MCEPARPALSTTTTPPPAPPSGTAFAASEGGHLFKLEDIALAGWLEWAAARRGFRVHLVKDRRSVPRRQQGCMHHAGSLRNAGLGLPKRASFAVAGCSAARGRLLPVPKGEKGGLDQAWPGSGRIQPCRALCCCLQRTHAAPGGTLKHTPPQHHP